MAEYVQQSIEEMLPELEQMERVGLFTAKETRAILKKRKGFEYKLRRRTKEKEDYLQYIQYEMDLKALVRKRREKTGYMFKKDEIDYAIIQRIHKLFKLVCFRFQDDHKLWLSHIEYCMKRGEKTTVSHLCTRMLQVHNRKPALWVMAAKWEFEEGQSSENARGLLQRGLRFNPKSTQLWTEYYRMELMHADKLRKRKVILGIAKMDDDELASDAILDGKVAHVVYKKALESIPENVEFHLSFLPVCRLFDFAKDQEDEIYRDLQYFHGDKELTWDAVAKRKLQRKEPADKDKESADATVMSAEENACLEVFDKAVDQLKTETMWTLYLKFCLERLEQEDAVAALVEQRIRNYLSVFERGHEVALLSSDMYLQWITVLLKTGLIQEGQEVCVKATERFPKAVPLWRQRVLLAIQCGESDDDVYKLFNHAQNAVKERESLPLWQLAIDWCLSSQSDKVEKLFEAGMASHRKVCVPMKEAYLEWAGLTGGIQRIRNVYDRLSTMQPLSVEFFNKYVDLENSQPKVNMKMIRKGYEDAVRDFGAKSTDLWLSYIKMEMHHPKGTPENAGRIHWRAVKTLEGALNDKFITQYTLLQTGHLS